MIDQELVELLICLNCRGSVEYRKDEEAIACTGECGYRYPVVKGIPHMLLSEAIRP